MTDVRRVLVVGLGTIAQTHLAVLEKRDDVAVVAGVDPVVTGTTFPVFGSLREALVSEPEPDLVVVATPTDTHVALVREVTAACGALVLSEKPLATTSTEIEDLGDVAERVRVAHHFAFSPEVEWAHRHVAAAGWGRPQRVLSTFSDAYAHLPELRRASLVSSWVDTGPNQLSLLVPFVGRCELVSHADEGHRAVTVLDHEGGRTVLTSNWLAADSAKQTSLRWHGDRELLLDHSALTVTVVVDGQVLDHVGYAGAVSRKEAHYRGLYDVLLTDPSDARLGVPLAEDIARVLESSVTAAPGAVRWSELAQNSSPTGSTTGRA